MSLTRTLSLLGIAAGLLWATTASAQSAYFLYYNQHPLPYSMVGNSGDDWCEEEDYHFHAWEPDPEEMDLYIVEDDAYVYIGDPLMYDDYQGEVYWYNDPHPVDYYGYHHICYLHGPHSHFFAPTFLWLDHYYWDSYTYRYYGPWHHSYVPHRSIHLSHLFPHRWDRHSHKHKEHKKKYSSNKPPKDKPKEHKGKPPGAHAKKPKFQLGEHADPRAVAKGNVGKVPSSNSGKKYDVNKGRQDHPIPKHDATPGRESAKNAKPPKQNNGHHKAGRSFDANGKRSSASSHRAVKNSRGSTPARKSKATGSRSWADWRADNTKRVQGRSNSSGSRKSKYNSGRTGNSKRNNYSNKRSSSSKRNNYSAPGSRTATRNLRSKTRSSTSPSSKGVRKSRSSSRPAKHRGNRSGARSSSRKRSSDSGHSTSRSSSSKRKKSSKSKSSTSRKKSKSRKSSAVRSSGSRSSGRSKGRSSGSSKGRSKGRRK